MPVFYCCLLYLVAMLAVMRTMVVLGIIPDQDDPGACLGFFMIGALWPIAVPGVILLGTVLMIFERVVIPCLTWLAGRLSQDEGDRT